MNPEQLAQAGTEHAEQCALFCFVNMAMRQGFAIAFDMNSYALPFGTAPGPNHVPALELFHAIKNAGHGDKIRGGRSKAEGVKPGIPDTHLPVARCGALSLYLELKRVKKGRLSSEQIKMQDRLRGEGNFVVNCKGWHEAAKALERYLS